MSFEQWINCRRGFDISIPRFVVDETAIVKQAGLNMQIFRQRRRYGTFVDIGFDKDVGREMDRTIERRLIRTLHFVEKSIPRFRIAWALANDGNAAPRSAAARPDVPIGAVRPVIDPSETSELLNFFLPRIAQPGGTNIGLRALG
jgi:hypothetical protein